MMREFYENRYAIAGGVLLLVISIAVNLILSSTREIVVAKPLGAVPPEVQVNDQKKSCLNGYCTIGVVVDGDVTATVLLKPDGTYASLAKVFIPQGLFTHQQVLDAIANDSDADPILIELIARATIYAQAEKPTPAKGTLPEISKQVIEDKVEDIKSLK